MEKAVGKNEKLGSFKLESFAEVGKSQAKLKRTERKLKVSFEVGKFRCSWKVVTEVGKFKLKLPLTQLISYPKPNLKLP